MAGRGEDSLISGDDSAEENYQSATDNTGETSSVSGSVVDSLTSSVRSAVEYVTELNLGVQGEQLSEEKASGLDDSKESGKNDLKGTAEDDVSPVHPERDEKTTGQQGSSGSGTSDDWSLVDAIAETLTTVPKDLKQAAITGDVSPQTANFKTPEIEAEESTSAAPPARVSTESAGPSTTNKDVTADNVGKSQRKADDSHGGPTQKSPVGGAAPLSFGDRSSSLRRRSRTSRMADSSLSSVESGVTGSHSPAGQSPRSHERHSSALKDKAKAGTHGREGRPASSVDIGRNARSILQAAESDTSEVDSSLGRIESIVAESTEQDRKVASLLEPRGKLHTPPSEQEKKGTDLSGYESEPDEEEAENGLTRLDRRPVIRGAKNEEAAAASSSSNSLDGEALTSGRTQRREVYTIPDTDAELEEGGSSNQLLAWPAELLVQTVAFQAKFIFQILSVSVSMFHVFTSLLTWPLHHTIIVRDRATDMAAGAVNQGYGLMSQVRDGVGQTGPLVRKLSKKTVMGCLGSAYVIFMLGLLLIPAFFLDLLLVRRMVDEPVQLRETLNFDFTQARPSAIVPVLTGQDLEKAKTLAVDKLVAYRRIQTGHNFRVNVILTLPESDYNLRLGMFQVTAETLSARNQVLLRQSKPCILPYRSAFIRLFRTVVYSLPLLMGFSSEAHRLEVTVLQAQEKMIPTASVRILLEPKAGFLEGGGLPELYEAELQLESVLPWPKAIIRRWKWTFYVWNGICLFLFEVAVVLCCCRQLLLPGFGGGTTSVENIVTGELKRPTKEEAAIRKSRSKRRVQFEDDIPVGAVGADGSALLGSRSDEAGSSNNSDDSDVDAESGWSMPPLEEAIATVEEGVRAVEESAKTLGDSIIGGVAEGLSGGL
ncbi:hypothetical protein R1sor_006484 [Riccia sorocarpa]|uniref:Seipin n=1 Tax=Riccia sorocarpa TaxID=122646 RepID=A0ABD3HN41_9MARC